MAYLGPFNFLIRSSIVLIKSVIFSVQPYILYIKPKKRI